MTTGRWHRLAQRAFRDLPQRLWPTLGTVLRLTSAAVLAYLTSVALTDSRRDLTGPLTALLVVQASASRRDATSRPVLAWASTSAEGSGANLGGI